MSIFSKKSAVPGRKAARKASLRQRQLRLEPLEGRRLFSADMMHTMDPGHGMDSDHAAGVTVTPTAILTHHDAIPRFGANPTNIAVVDGLWSDADVWSTGQVPGADDIVSIPSGVSVVYDVESTAKLDVIEVSGRLDFATGVDTSLWLNELMVMPSGTLTIGTEQSPVSAAVSAEIVITDTPGTNGLHFKTGTVEQPGVDPSQWGNGILGFGTIEVHGQEKTSSYIRLAEEPLAGDRVLVLESEPVGWQTGDELVLPDTSSSWSAARVEELIIESINGNRVTLTQPLAHSHQGPRSASGAEPLILPHIGNLSRNVVVRSENPAGVRGHVAFMSRADIDINYARFKDLGRTNIGALNSTTYDQQGEVTHIGTNQIARYAMHFHHVDGPMNLDDTGYQFEVNGNAVDGARRWGIVVHGSHYGLVKDNFVYDYQGAGFVTENGLESYNVFEGNFAVLSRGDGKSFKEGDAGEGFWFRGPLTTVVNNVSANSQRAGFVHYVQNLHGQYRNDWVKPAFRGADMSVSTQVINYNVFHAPVLQFEGNEVYGSAAVYDNWSSTPSERQYLSAVTGWNTSDNMFSLSSYNNSNLVVDGLTLIGDLSALNPKVSPKHQPISEIGIDAVRESENITILNSEIRGVQTGFKTPSRVGGEMVIADSVFQAYVGVNVGRMTRAGDLQAEPDYARIVIENTRFERMPENLVQPDQYAVYTSFDMNGNLTKTNEIFLYDFNGVPGANYRVYYPQQAPNYVVPTSVSKKLIGSPEAGLTNAQTWEKYGIAIGGSVAPSQEYDGDNGEAALARGKALGIHGLVFPLEGDAGRNQAPVVSAGTPITVEQYRQVLLSGQVTDDELATGALGGTAHIDWSKLSGPGEVIITSRASEETLALFTEPGTYVMRLTASDGLRESRNDVSITVLPASNRAPIVNAGNDVVLTENNVTTLRGTASDDGNPHGMLHTHWSVVSGPGSAKFSDPTQLTTEVLFTSTGTYVLELHAFDGELTSTDRVEVTVNVAMPVSPLLVHLKMNDTNALDSSQHELHGEASGVGVESGRSGGATSFTGNSYVALPKTEFLQPKTGLTAAVLVRPSVVDGVSRPVMVWDGGSWDAYSISLNNRAGSALVTIEMSTETGGKTIATIGTGSFPVDEWTHLALTYNQEGGGRLQLYRDGELIGSKSNIGGPLVYKMNTAQRLTVGKEKPGSAGPGFIGAMNDLFVYDYALSPAELAHLMMGHAPHMDAPHSGTTPPPSGGHEMHMMHLMASVPTDGAFPLLNATAEAEPLDAASLTSDPIAILIDQMQPENHHLAADHLLATTADTDELESGDSWVPNVDAALTADLELVDWYLTA